jgi:FO synthase
MAKALDARADGGPPIDDETAFSLIEQGDASTMQAAARAVRDRTFGRTLTYSPKVFLPVTNLCRNRCDYCSFRKSPGDDGEWTMTPDQIEAALVAGREQGCAEALLCLGDKPEGAFSAYRRTLAGFGQASTVDYLVWASERALANGLLAHTNAGVLNRDDMTRLKEVNASLGLMLETSSERLCQPGMAHHRAPDKRPARRLAMLRGAGELGIAFTTGILLGIGETKRERVESLLAIRDLCRDHGHIQEIIVQSFRARPGVVMAEAPEPADVETAEMIALARLVLPDDVTVQAPPNLHPETCAMLIDAGLNDWGGISPVTPDYINHRHPWPHLDALKSTCASRGFELAPRLPIHRAWAERAPFLAERMKEPVNAAAARLSIQVSA